AMYDELKKYDNAEVYLTRTEDVGMSLKDRAEIAASVDADFLFSLHYNASLSHELYGSEVWISSKEPYQEYGYQFACVQMESMQDMGLFLRGVKTRIGDNNDDYYGIIRECVALSVPAVIIEHCHVDNDRDAAYCDSDEALEAFGRADALSAAKYLGLYSTELGVDYRSLSSELADVSESGSMYLTVNNYTGPEICNIEISDINYDTGDVIVDVAAADYSGMLLYYDYSIDGGQSYSQKEPWPDSNIFTGEYDDTPQIVINIPSNTDADIIFRAYDLFDLYTESNTASIDGFVYGDEAVKAASASASVNSTDVAEAGLSAAEADTAAVASSEAALPGTTTFKPDETVSEEETVSFFSFLIICLIIVLLLFVIVIVSQMITRSRRRKRRRRRMEDSNRYRR
ncbi:MAG: N-acetylmuramoyl-L-alanine amidase, partial [Lachnospiraceae bacterium]|nr:N-acetylmuramoyl-L-alanine amidase [Lachnospiraceae bacterium]